MKTNFDPNKRNRDRQRRILQRAGWIAVPALKDNNAHQWKWIHHERKKAYSRDRAFAMACRDLEKKLA
jgi:hypothetical protein